MSNPHSSLRKTVGFVVLATVALTCGASCPTTARATTFVDVTIEDLARASDLVVVGRVEHVEVLPQGPAGQPGIHTRAVVQVAETLRGEHQTIIEVWVQGGRLGDRMRVIPGQAQFRVGEDVVLFLFRAGDGLWPTSFARGKWTSRDLERWLPTTGSTDPLTQRLGRGVALDELRRRVPR